MNYYEQYKVTVPEGKSGDWKVTKFTVKENDIGAIRCALSGRPISPGIYTRLMREGAGFAVNERKAPTKKVSYHD